MELYEILALILGLIVCIGLDRVYRLFKDIKENGILNQIEYTISDDNIQNIVGIVLTELEKKKNVNNATEEKLQSPDS